VTGAAARRPVPGVPEAWPEEAAGALMRGLGRYLRDVPVLDLPPAIRRFRGWRQAALRPHREQLLAALGTPEHRPRLVEWLDGGPRMGAEERDVLRLWAERPEGWERGVKDGWEPGLQDEGEVPVKEPGRAGKRMSQGAGADEEDELRRARERVKKARAQTRRARAAERSAIEAARKEIDELTHALSDLRARLARTEQQARTAAEDAQRAAAARERELRRARRAEARARAERDRARAEAKAARSESSPAARPASAARRGQSRPAAASASPAVRPARRPLAVPPGLPGDDAQTLARWLDTPGVRLLVDGYNVSKSEAGFGRLRLEDQRRRTVDEVARLARKHGVPATVVFDGSEVAPGTFRRRKPDVGIEYSKPPQSADDLLVERLAELPPDPVVVVTSDRGLQARARPLGATIATSEQLLASIR
jgi:predicted RNA-binding protein with PIN domain